MTHDLLVYRLSESDERTELSDSFAHPGTGNIIQGFRDEYSISIDLSWTGLYLNILPSPLECEDVRQHRTVSFWSYSP